MRCFVARPLGLVLAVLAVPLAVGTVAGPAFAAAPTDACTERLATGSRESFAFRAGRSRLAWARLVVTPTSADADRYCVEVRFGGRKPSHRTSLAGYERRNGRWVHIGDSGGGSEPRRSYTESLQIDAGRRYDRLYEVRSGGRWYAAEVSLRNP